MKQKIALYKERFRIFYIHLKHFIKFGYYSFSVERYNVYPEKKICYIDLPKTASTSIKKLMIDEHHLDIEGYDIQNFHSRNFATNHFENDGGYFSFSFVRNPYERLVSTYLNRYHGGDNITKTYDYYLFGLMQEDKGFEHFVRTVAKIPDWLAEDHFVSQYATLYDKNGKRKADFIGKFENIKEDWKKIQEYTNLPELPHYNKSSNTHWIKYYTPELADIVYKRYRKDFELFGYDRNILSFFKEYSQKTNKTTDAKLTTMREADYKDICYCYSRGGISRDKYRFLPSYKLGYLINYKTASSSILSILLDTNGIHIEENVHNIATQNLPNKVDNMEEYFIFTFVRNPFERLASCYQNKVIDEANHTYNSFNIYLFGYLKQVSSFYEFVERICNIPNHILEGHISLQYDIIYDKNGKCRVHFIGKYENINEDWKVMQEKYKLPNLPILNKTEKKDWRDFYTIETAKLVYQKYKKDIDTFGYTKEHNELINYLKNK